MKAMTIGDFQQLVTLAIYDVHHLVCVTKSSKHECCIHDIHNSILMLVVFSEHQKWSFKYALCVNTNFGTHGLNRSVWSGF